MLNRSHNFMTDQELETLLTQQCNTLKLKETAFETLETIFVTSSNDTEFLCGFKRSEIITIFDGFEYRINRRHGDAIIRTRIGFYIENKNWLDDMQPIGYYELETNLSGEVLDDYFVIEKEKYIDDIGIISHFQSINKNLPAEYMKRNHI